MQPGYGPFLQPPLCLALILARSVSYSEATGVWSIVGPYFSLALDSFPVEFVSMEAYVVLTECDGHVLVELKLEDVNAARPPVFRQLTSVFFDGPQDVREIIFHNHQVTIPVDGDYRLLLTVFRPDFSQSEYVMERRLIVSHIP